MGILSNIGTLFSLLIHGGADGKPRYKIGTIGTASSHIDPVVPQMIEIGSNFISSPGSMVLAHDESPFMHCGMYKVKKTRVGDNVFLGPGAIIAPGVIVGNGAIISAGSVVTGNVPPDTVVAGNPARVVCTVSEYIRDCKNSDCLYEVPEAFRSVFWGGRLSEGDIKEFQKMVRDKAKDLSA
jgi:acetyltransferase-like isoleucine patch superfamily enzyme